MNEKAIEAALHEARTYGIGATSDHNQKIIVEAATRFAALPPLRAREEIARVCEILKELAEPLNYRQFTKWDPQALASEALAILSSTAGQEWRDISSAPHNTDILMGAFAPDGPWRANRGCLSNPFDKANPIVWDWGWSFLPTHWMPLPEPPK